MATAVVEKDTRPEIPRAAVGGAIALASNDFTKLLHGCMLDKLEELIGKNTTKLLLFHFKLDQNIANPREFHRRLELLLSEGAMILEKSIVRELYRRLNISYDEASPFEFEKCVDRAKKVFAAKTKGE